MSCSSTVHAHVLATLASGNFIEPASPLDIVVALRLRTPFQIPVLVHVDIHFKLEVLFVDFFRTELLNSLFVEELLTPSALHAGNLLNPTILDVSSKMVKQAISAELMATFKSKEVSLEAIFTADVALLRRAIIYQQRHFTL